MLMYFANITLTPTWVQEQTNSTKGNTMSGKAKSCYLTVSLKGSFKTVLSKVFFNAKDLNDFIKTEEFKALYPTTEFNITKEVY